jgi:ABC-type sugar transport system ATPase subunit
MNFLDAELTRKTDGTRAVAFGVPVELPEDLSAALNKNEALLGPVVLGIRPEHLRLADEGIPAKVDVLEHMAAQ